MKKIVFLLIVIAVSNAPIANAEGEIRGVRTCEDWSKDRAKNDWTVLLIDKSWLIGYLSGLASATGKDFLHGTNNLAIYDWMDQYCKDNPQKHLGDAGLDLFYELKKQKGL